MEAGFYAKAQKDNQKQKKVSWLNLVRNKSMSVLLITLEFKRFFFAYIFSFERKQTERRYEFINLVQLNKFTLYII